LLANAPRQAVFFRELRMARAVVQAHPDHLRAHVVDRENVVAELARFLGATRRVVLGVEVQHHPPAAEIGEGVSFTQLIRQAELRRSRAHGRQGRTRARNAE
jgi:hypothetical protein